jgi:hypothetical protein
MGRWYYSGGALQEPRKILADRDYRSCGENCGNVVEFSIPGTKIKVLRQKGDKNED